MDESPNRFLPHISVFRGGADSGDSGPSTCIDEAFVELFTPDDFT